MLAFQLKPCPLLPGVLTALKVSFAAAVWEADLQNDPVSLIEQSGELKGVCSK